ncbi:trypsin-like peptidase domain-containing protein [Methylosinus sporium]|uniref:trypsin-like peptidase domain-containing protein n=1 Tax=Methylosinus sporium TaxID=428 RepID=UPI00383B6B4D
MRAFLRLLFTVAALGASVPYAGAESRPPGYADAERAFSALTPAHRLYFQVLMTGAGYFNAVPTERLSTRLFNGIKQFQAENGLPQTGAPDVQQIERLFSVATPMFDLWRFQKIYHPARRVGIWIPIGLGMIATRNDKGISWDDPRKRVHIDFTTVPNIRVSQNFEGLAGLLANEGAKIHYKVMKGDWFVISFSLPNGVDGYMRYHQDGQFVTGFSLYWNNDYGNVSGERIAVLMSGSLWSEMTGAPFPSPPEPNVKTVAKPYAPPSPPPASAPTPAPMPPKEEAKFSSGTGFFVSQNGSLVTNAHVVDGCSDAVVKLDDGTIGAARILARDTTNDLAILKVDKTPKKVGALRVGARLGEGIATFGYPHADILASSGNFTLGNITALSGIGDDSRFVQISAPVQSGNSGGPLLDMSGNVVGVVTSKLNALKVALNNGDLPQNVNFAVKAAILATFLDANKVTFEGGGGNTASLAPADLADLARNMSGFVACKTSQ